jgi:hypothetical protein
MHFQEDGSCRGRLLQCCFATLVAHEADPDSPKVVSKEKWFEGPAEFLETLRQPSSVDSISAVRKKA